MDTRSNRTCIVSRHRAWRMMASCLTALALAGPAAPAAVGRAVEEVGAGLVHRDDRRVKRALVELVALASLPLPLLADVPIPYRLTDTAQRALEVA